MPVPLKLYRTASGTVLASSDSLHALGNIDWNQLTTREDLFDYLSELSRTSVRKLDHEPPASDLLPPVGAQEVWAAGVTYFRSRDARMEESKSAGGGDFYDRVYHAQRPELFFKATSHRVVGHGAKVAIRSDAKWSVPEPELVLLVSSQGKILGYTIGNDMSSRDIEGENPLYLPQAKVYSRSCAIGPCILVSPDPLPSSTEIQMQILRGGAAAFSGSVTLDALKRELSTLVAYLYRDNEFPHGAFLFTGTGIVPPDSFTLMHGDEIRITIDGIGTLANVVG